MSRLAGERSFPKTPPFQRHSDTSRQAAISVMPKLGDLHRKVWAYIRDSGGCTDEQGATALAMNPSTYRPRRIELMRAGYIREALEPGLTRAGKNAVVWTVTAKGRAV